MKYYIDRMPINCVECEHCTKHYKDNYGIPYCLIARMPLYNGDKIYEERGQHKGSLSDFDCPLKSQQYHDKELVAKVCKKIKQFCNEEKNQIEDWCGWTSILKSNLDKFLDQIQKEFEDE